MKLLAILAVRKLVLDCATTDLLEMVMSRMKAPLRIGDIDE